MLGQGYKKGEAPRKGEARVRNFKKDFNQFLDVLEEEVESTWLDDEGELTTAGVAELESICWLSWNVKTRKGLERVLAVDNSGWTRGNLSVWLAGFAREGSVGEIGEVRIGEREARREEVY